MGFHSLKSYLFDYFSKIIKISTKNYVKFSPTIPLNGSSIHLREMISEYNSISKLSIW